MGFVEFINTPLLGARLWIWLLLVATILFIVMVIAIINRERIRAKWLKFRYPERTIKIVIHYPGNMYKVFWRLIPNSDNMILADAKYHFSKKKLIKEAYEDKADKLDFMLNGKRYEFHKDKRTKAKHSAWPEIHYAYDCVMPLDFTKIDKGQLEVSSTEFKALQENDLWLQLLTMKDTIQQMNIILIMMAINLLGTIFIIGKIMGWIK